MKIVCPSCEAAYEVPEVVLTSRRKMRCARCAHDWVPGAAMAAPAAASEPVPSPPVVAPSPAEVPAMAAAPPEPDPAPVHAEEVAAAHEPLVEADVAIKDEPDIEPPQDLRQYLVVRPDTPVVMFPDEIVPPRASPIPPKILVVPPAAEGQPWLAWGASIGLLVVLIAAAVLFRGPVMKIWPPSVRVYTALGLSQ